MPARLRHLPLYVIPCGRKGPKTPLRVFGCLSPTGNRFSSLLIALALIASLAACKEEKARTDYSAQPPPGPITSGDRLNLAMLGDASVLVPFLSGDSASSEIGGFMFNALLKYDANLNLVGDLAQSWETSNGGRTITFTLRPDATFSDGTPLTSADVLATFNGITNPETKTAYAGDYLMVKKAEAPTPQTFRITYDKPFVPALASWASLSILPKHILDKTPSINDTSLKSEPIGTGPYQLARWRRGQDVLLTANPKSYEKPPIGQYYYRIIPDDSTQFMELRAGNLDIAGLKPLAYNRLTDDPWFTNNYQKIRYLSNGYTYLGFNLKNPLFADKRVRQALSYAIDRQGLINAVLFGQGLPLAGVFKPGTWAYNETLQPYPYDPQRAKQLLAEAGWKDTDGDGWLDKDGKPFRFSTVTNQGNDARLKSAQVIQKFFRDIGVDMQILVQEWSTFVGSTIKGRAFETILLGWSLSAEPDPYDIWHSSKTKPDEFNVIGFSNKRADWLMEQAQLEFHQPKRKEYLDEFQAILQEEQPYLWLYAPYTLMAVHKRIIGITPAPAGIGYNQPEWGIPQGWHLRPALQH